MAINFRGWLFVFLFLCIINAAFSQEDDGRYRHRFAWTEDKYAFSYEVIIEKEENDEYSVVLKEFTEEPFIFFSLHPGNYRLRVTSYDFRNNPGGETPWKNFKVIASAGSDSKSQTETDELQTLLSWQEEETTPEEEVIIIPDEDTAENSMADSKRKKNLIPVQKHSNLFFAAYAEGSGYTRYSAAFGGGLSFGGSFNNIGFGISLLHVQDAEEFISFETALYARLYLLRSKSSTGPFLQVNGGIVFFSLEKFEFTDDFSLSAGLSAGWRFPMGKYWFIEPSVSGGYPYIFNASLSVGIRFAQRPAQTSSTAAGNMGKTSTVNSFDSSNIIPSESIVVFTGNGHKYEIIQTTTRYKIINTPIKTWTDARIECEKRGGYLATITSEEEQKFIEDLLSKNGKRDTYWIGGYKEKGRWQWVTGESFVYTNWRPGQPNNFNHQDDKLLIVNYKEYGFSKLDLWHSANNRSFFDYICEWD